MCEMGHKSLGGYREIMVSDKKEQVGIVHEKLNDANNELALQKKEKKSE